MSRLCTMEKLSLNGYLSSGVEMYVIPDNTIYDLPQLCSFVSKNKITRMLFTPSLLEAALDTHSDEAIRSTFRTFRYLIAFCYN